MGSDSDWPVMGKAAQVLDEFGISHMAHVSSAHRAHDRTVALARRYAARGTRVFIAGAGAAAHLAGVLAAVTTRPVIGVPLASSPLAGFDALLSTVQMPPGIPVACTAVGEGGARNAALLAVAILAVADRRLEAKLHDYRRALEREVARKDANLAKEPRPGSGRDRTRSKRAKVSP